MKKYAIIIERVPNSNYCASVPDLPGCVAIGDTLEELHGNIREAIEFHIEGMREDGLPLPEPTTPLSRLKLPLIVDERDDGRKIGPFTNDEALFSD